MRLFAHPGNPDARAAAIASAARKARSNAPESARAARRLGCRLRHGARPRAGAAGRARTATCASRSAPPATLKRSTRPVLANWAQLQSALHPQGAKATNALLGATASEAFLLSKAQLQRTVLTDPGITLDACARHEVAAGAVNKRVLAVLAFLSRSGLEPTVSALRCEQRQYKGPGASLSGDEVDISAINGTQIAGHQGPETITELTIRTLLSMPAEFVPHQIVSLMRFPSSPSTSAASAAWNHIHLEFSPPKPTPTLSAAATATAAHSASSGRTAPSPLVSTAPLSAAQWSQLMDRVAALPMPGIRTKPSSAAIPDPKSKR